MGIPHQSPAFLLGAGSNTDPDSALLLDTNIQVRCAAGPRPAQARHITIKHLNHATDAGLEAGSIEPQPRAPRGHQAPGALR